MTKLQIVAPVFLGLSAMDWPTLRVTPWEEERIPYGDGELVMLKKRYMAKRRDGMPLAVVLSSLPGDAGIIMGDLEIQATRALRSYEGCVCVADGTTPCKAHAKGVDIRTFRGMPDWQANTPQGLRDYLEARNAKQDAVTEA